MSIKKLTTESGVTFDFDEQHELVTDLANLPQEIVQRLAVHGLSQKVGDAYANNDGPADAYARAKVVYESLQAGQWNAGRSGAGGDLVEAVMGETNQSREAVTERLAAMSKEEKTALRKNAKIAARLATIKAKRAAERAALADDEPLEALFG